MKQRYNPIHDYLSYEDLLGKLGYGHHSVRRVGSFGKALMTASKNNKSVKWLKHHLDTYFNHLRGNKEKHLELSK